MTSTRTEAVLALQAALVAAHQHCDTHPGEDVARLLADALDGAARQLGTGPTGVTGHRLSSQAAAHVRGLQSCAGEQRVPVRVPMGGEW